MVTEHADHELAICTFPRVDRARGRQRKITWGEMCQLFANVQTLARKEDGTLWSPTEYSIVDPPGAVNRKAEHVRSVTCLVLDIDNGTPYECLPDAARAYEHIIHTTYSHSNDNPKYRLIYPLVRPVNVDEWAGVFEEANHLLTGGNTDGQTKDACRIFYLPAKRGGDKGLVVLNKGPLLDTSALKCVLFRANPESPVVRHSDTSRRYPAEKLIDKYVREAQFGTRNRNGFNLACQLRDCQYTLAEIEHGLIEYHRRAPDGEQPYDLKEAIASAKSAFSRTAREPLTPPRPLPTNGNVPHKREETEERQPSGFALTDYGNAQRMVWRHQLDLRYCHPFGCFFVWDGRRWLRDETGEAMRRAKETVRSMYAEAAAQDPPDTELIKHAFRSEAAKGLNALLQLVQSELPLPVLPAQLDSDPWLLNTDNGTLDLRTGLLTEHRREHLNTKRCPVAYSPSASCPKWEAFLRSVLLDNEAMIGFVQRLIGYCLTGLVTEQVIPFLYGAGSNGKSTLLNVVREMMGDYADVAAPGLLLEHRGDRHTTDIIDLMGKRFVISVEVGEGKRLAEELVKAITGGDKLKGRFMRHDNVAFDPTHKIWLAANHKPVIRGTDEGIWRRIPLIPFKAKFEDEPENERFRKNRNLIEELRAEFPGILAWAVQGCLEWQRIGLRPPVEISEAVAEYRKQMDVIGEWVEDCCEQGDSFRALHTDAWASFDAWCSGNGERNTLSRNEFKARMSERGFEFFRSNGRKYWRGLMIRTDDAPAPLF